MPKRTPKPAAPEPQRLVMLSLRLPEVLLRDLDRALEKENAAPERRYTPRTRSDLIRELAIAYVRQQEQNEQMQRRLDQVKAEQEKAPGPVSDGRTDA